MATRTRATSTPQAPTFVFKGTVKRLKDATMKDVPVNNRTTIVTVNQVIDAPKALAGYAGKDITVQLSGRAPVRPGQELIFHTNGWMFGDGVAVRSEAQEPVSRSHAALLSTPPQPTRVHALREIQSRVADADVVVSGKVTAVRPATSASTRTQRTAAATRVSGRKPVSEHDPDWQEAVVAVDQVHKGIHKERSIVVSFPASNDVRWFKAPKFRAGQEGTFILQKAPSAAPVRRGVAMGLRAGAQPPAPAMYTALHTADFQPKTGAADVEMLVRAEPKAPSRTAARLAAKPRGKPRRAPRRR